MPHVQDFGRGKFGLVCRLFGGATCIFAAVAACGSEASRAEPGGGVTSLTSTSAGDDAATDAVGTDDPGDASGGDGSSGMPGVDQRFDVGGAGDEGGVIDQGCAEVDFLFVIDNSDSMSDKQAQLVGAFPGFMSAIQTELSASDYHIMVTDTDAWGKCSPGDCSGSECTDPIAGTYVCQQNLFDVCDRTRGAGVVHPAGRFATNAPCMPAGGHRYLTQDEPDLPGMFECVATVGTAGDGKERPMDSLVAAMDPAINAVGGCNDGFLREDAILVVTFISDDPWDEDSGDPNSWYQAVVDAKQGEAEKVVVLGLTPAWPGCRDGNGPPKGEHWKQFVEMWGDRGLHGNVCGTAEEYVSFFEAAVATIDATCEANPPG